MAEAARSFLFRSRSERRRKTARPASAQFPNGPGPRLPAVLAILLLFLPAAAARAQAMSDAARQQIQSLLAEKESRTPAQRKIDSRLLYAMRQGRGLDAAPGVSSLQTGIALDAAQTTEVHITANVTAPLLQSLRKLGAQIIDTYPWARSIRARVPISALETIAADPAVYFVGPKHQFLLEGEGTEGPRQFVYTKGKGALVPRRTAEAATAADPRAASVRSRLASALAARPFDTDVVNVSEGDVTHRANLARSTFGVTGAGVKVGVLSDGVDSLASLQASGDLPAVVTVLPGQAGAGNEGAAMLEIVHDLAPNAQLYFSTGGGSPAQMAQNILDLRAAGCDVIVDDIRFFTETPFQKGQAPSVISTTGAGLVIEAVNTVTADGALYFASAGNAGNKNDGQSGTWEGDFADGGAVGAPITGTGTLHDFDPGAPLTAFDQVTAAANPPRPANLFWSDPLGASSNDYDLFELNAAGSAIVSASTNVQSGTQDPYEELGVAAAVNDRLVIVKRTGAANRFLHLGTNRGRLLIGTQGETRGHNSSPGATAFGVAATPAVGPYPGVFSSTDDVETFSSDGPRRYFYNANGTAITPGNFSSTGGQVLNKPDVTAADGVSCAAPGFNPFFGTSAAAPHAAAIAALVKSSGGTAADVKAALISTAIDIEAAGVDRDSGAGILDAFAAVGAAGAEAFLFVSNKTATEASGNGNALLEPGECGSLSIELTNGNATIGATSISATLTTSTPGVTIFSETSAYPNLPGSAHGVNATPFTFGMANTVACPLDIDFTLTVTFTGGTSPQVIHFNLPTGTPPWSVTTTLDATTPPVVAGVTAATGTETGGLATALTASTCPAPPAFPGFGDFGGHQYDIYNFTNCSSSTICVTVTLTYNSGGGALPFVQAAVYSPTFVPANPQTNYLANPDLVTTGTKTFSVNVPGNSTFAVVVSEVIPGNGIGLNYTLGVDGVCAPCSAYTGPGTCPGGATPTRTRTFTSTPTRTSTFTSTPTRTNTSTSTPTRTNTSTRTSTSTNTATRTNTPTRTATSTRTVPGGPTSTRTFTPSRTFTSTQTFTATRTSTSTSTPTRTPTSTATVPGGPTATRTGTPTRTPTPGTASAFHTIAPCRAIDTRQVADGPALQGGQTRTFALVGKCGIPASAKAISYNVTVTGPTAGGDLRIFPAGTALPVVSTINYGAGKTRANNGVAAARPGRHQRALRPARRVEHALHPRRERLFSVTTGVRRAGRPGWGETMGERLPRPRGPGP